MQFNTVTQQQLDRLPIPRNKWRLDLLLKPNRDAVTKKVHTGFETLETCWAEDRRRARALRQLPEQLRKVVGYDPVALAEVLEVGAQHKTVPACGASAAYMRDRRLAFLGSLLKLIDQNKDLEMLFISVTEREWCFDWHDDLTKVEEDIHYRSKRLLNSVRIWDFPGFLVACVNGVYDVGTGKIR